MFETPADMAAAIRGARGAFRDMEDHMTARELDGGDWFVGGKPTIADVALFPAIALSRDTGIEHDAYPALGRWIRRFRGLPGFRTMPGVPDYY
jgi:glutathione S-transferase